jgi:hypothetical protein
MICAVPIRLPANRVAQQPRLPPHGIATAVSHKDISDMQNCMNAEHAIPKIGQHSDLSTFTGKTAKIPARSRKVVKI